MGVLYRTRNSGLSWTRVLTDEQSIRSIAVDYQKPNVIYTVADSYRVYKSQDYGDTWTVVHRPPWEPGGGISGNRLAIDPRVPSHLYLGGGGYIGETADGGLTWSDETGPINQGTPPREPSALSVANTGMTQTLYASFNILWRHVRLAPQPGSAMTTTLSSNVMTITSGSALTLTTKVVDQAENWVANGTAVTFSSPGFIITTTVEVNAGYGVVFLPVLKPGIAVITATSDAARSSITVMVEENHAFLPALRR